MNRETIKHWMWIEEVSTLENAREWLKTDEKWIFVDDCLSMVGCTLTLTDNPRSLEWCVDKIEEKFREYLN